MKKFFVNVSVEMGDYSTEYDWYSVTAANASEAEDKVCEWLEENTTYADNCAIECVREEMPILITAID